MSSRLSPHTRTDRRSVLRQSLISDHVANRGLWQERSPKLKFVNEKHENCLPQILVWNNLPDCAAVLASLAPTIDQRLSRSTGKCSRVNYIFPCSSYPEPGRSNAYGSCPPITASVHSAAATCQASFSPKPLSGAALPQSHSLALPAPKRRTNGRIWRIASRIPIQSFAPDLTAFPSFENGFLPKRGQPDPSPYGQSCARTGDRQFAGSALASMGVVTTGMFYVAVLPFSFSALPSIGSSLTNSPPRQKPRFAARAPRLRPPR